MEEVQIYRETQTEMINVEKILLTQHFRSRCLSLPDCNPNLTNVPLKML